MKVNKKKFIECLNYLTEINYLHYRVTLDGVEGYRMARPLTDLNFSEFGEVPLEVLEKWRLTGLANTDILKMVFLEQEQGTLEWREKE